MGHDLVIYRSDSLPARRSTKSRIELRRISDLKFNPRNPRQHPPKQIAQIAASIREFGMLVPVLVDQNNHVIAGHGRIFACQKLGWPEVPTIRVDHLTPNQIRAFAIADNRLTENAVWDEQLLGEAFLDLSLSDLHFDIEITGFETPEIDLLIQGLQPDDVGEDDAAPVIPTESPVSRVGDLWVLGGSRLFCGNALDREALIWLMTDQLAGMVITDPPYNVKIDGHAGGLGAIHHREFPMASGEMTPAEFSRFLGSAFALCAEFSADGSLHYIFMDWRHQAEILCAGSQAYTELKNLCIWDKGVGGMGSLYRSQHELVYVYKSGTAVHRNNIQLGRFSRNRTNIWRYPGANSFSRGNQEGNLLAVHPTVKPVAMIADAILDASARGDVILDPFLGSGTTLIAAERSGRRCAGIELDPLYVDIAVRRWQTLTGKKARHAQTNELFDDRADIQGEQHGG
jgi:DNA modification methylase